MLSEAGEGVAEAPWLVRVDDAWHRWRERRARRHGLVPTVVPFIGYGTPSWARVIGRVVLMAPEAASPNPGAKLRGWRSFLAATVNSAEVELLAGNKVLTIRSDRGGVIDTVIPVGLEPGWRAVIVRIGEQSSEIPIEVVDEDARLGIVSDIDDTVMVTALPRPFLAAWNTFVIDENARRPVAGMAVMYDRVLRAHSGSAMVYLSTGAWNVAPTLTRFLARNVYPRGALLLTNWGPTLDRWFRSGPAHKAENLARLASEFPKMRWLLVGDDGQHDEQIYREFAAAHPDNVAAVAIRRLTPGQAVLAGGRSGADAPDTDGIPWIYGDDGAGLISQLEQLGLLPTV